jgi:hypothetical protein
MAVGVAHTDAGARDAVTAWHAAATATRISGAARPPATVPDR